MTDLDEIRARIMRGDHPMIAVDMNAPHGPAASQESRVEDGRLVMHPDAFRRLWDRLEAVPSPLDLPLPLVFDPGPSPFPDTQYEIRVDYSKCVAPPVWPMIFNMGPMLDDVHEELHAITLATECIMGRWEDDGGTPW